MHLRRCHLRATHMAVPAWGDGLSVTRGRVLLEFAPWRDTRLPLPPCHGLKMSPLPDGRVAAMTEERWRGEVHGDSGNGMLYVWDPATRVAARYPHRNFGTPTCSRDALAIATVIEVELYDAGALDAAACTIKPPGIEGHSNWITDFAPLDGGKAVVVQDGGSVTVASGVGGWAPEATFRIEREKAISEIMWCQPMRLAMLTPTLAAGCAQYSCVLDLEAGRVTRDLLRPTRRIYKMYHVDAIDANAVVQCVDCVTLVWDVRAPDPIWSRDFSSSMWRGHAAVALWRDNIAWCGVGGPGIAVYDMRMRRVIGSVPQDVVGCVATDMAWLGGGSIGVVAAATYSDDGGYAGAALHLIDGEWNE
jgi:hypothetical protein